MKKIIFYSIALCTLLYSDNTDKEVFIEKYINKDDYKTNQLQAEEYRKNISKDVNIKEISKKEGPTPPIARMTNSWPAAPTPIASA